MAGASDTIPVMRIGPEARTAASVLMEYVASVIAFLLGAPRRRLVAVRTHRMKARSAASALEAHWHFSCFSFLVVALASPSFASAPAGLTAFRLLFRVFVRAWWMGGCQW